MCIYIYIYTHTPRSHAGVRVSACRAVHVSITLRSGDARYHLWCGGFYRTLANMFVMQQGEVAGILGEQGLKSQGL